MESPSCWALKPFTVFASRSCLSWVVLSQWMIMTGVLRQSHSWEMQGSSDRRQWLEDSPRFLPNSTIPPSFPLSFTRARPRSWCMFLIGPRLTQFDKDCVLGGSKCANTIQKTQCWRHSAFVRVYISENTDLLYLFNILHISAVWYWNIEHPFCTPGRTYVVLCS